MKFYLKAAGALMTLGSVVVGLYFFVYETPSVPAKEEPPILIAPISSPGLIPEQPKVKPLPSIGEPMQKEQEPAITEDPLPVEASISTAIESEQEPSVENVEVFQQHPEQAEEIQTIQDEPEPGEGEWQSRGARLKQGRKLTVRASQLMQQGRYTEASIVLKDAIHMFPQKTKDLTYGEALYKLGICLRRKGQPEQAIPVLREAMQFPYYRSKVIREVEAATGQIQRTKLNQSPG